VTLLFRYKVGIYLSSLTQKDIELARRYIVIRSAIKGFSRDKQRISEGDFELRSFYSKFIEDALVKTNDQLRELHKYPIQVKITDQPTVYEVKIGNRNGYIEMNAVEIKEEINKLTI
jgi:hypothetical protein